MTKSVKLLGLAAVTIVAAVFFVDAGSCSRAEAPRKYSSIEIESSKTGDNLNLKFKVIPASNWIINEDGPWKLEIKKSDGLALHENKLDKTAVDFTIPGYSVTTTKKPSVSKGDISYKMIVFICTKDKSTCVRDVHDSTGTWTLK